MIWFTSDTHYHHTNIVRGVSRWTEKGRCRDFATLEEHNEQIIKNINAVVMLGDTLYHLGDWSFGGIEQIWAFRRRLHCKDIHLILGNHDHHLEHDKEIPEYQRGDVTFGHNNAELTHLQQFFSSVQHYKELHVNGRHIVLCHYAMRVWNKSHKGSIMLHGHSHGTLDVLKPEFTEPTWIGESYFLKNNRTMDVGIDCHPDFRPFSMTEIVDEMKKKDLLFNSES